MCGFEAFDLRSEFPVQQATVFHGKLNGDLDILGLGAVIHDTGAQHKTAMQDGVRRVDPTRLLQRMHH